MNECTQIFNEMKIINKNKNIKSINKYVINMPLLQNIQINDRKLLYKYKHFCHVLSKQSLSDSIK